MIGYLKYFIEAFLSSNKSESHDTELDEKLNLLKSRNNTPLDENIKQLLSVKKKINRLKKRLKTEKDVDEKRKIKKDLEKLWEIYEYIEDKLKKPELGLYMGVGVDLLAEEERKIAPVWFEWKSLNSHMGVQGTTRTGKTVLLLNIAKQIIRKQDNLIVIDPKGSEGQEVLATILEEAVNTGRHKDFVYLSPAYTSISDRYNVIFDMSNEAIASMLSKIVEGEQFFRDVVYKVTFAVCKAFEVLEELQAHFIPNFKERLLKKEIEKYNKYVKHKGYEPIPINEEEELYRPDDIDLMDKSINKLEEERLFKDKNDISSFLFSRTLMTLKDIAYFSRHDTLVELKDILENNFLQDGKIRKDIPEWLQNEAIQAINTVNDVAKQEKSFFEKTSTSLSTILTQLVTGKMGEILTSIKINPLIARLERGEGVICVIQSYPMLFKNISDMMVKSFLYMIEYLMGKYGARGIAPKKRLHIMIDEAASVVYPDIDNLFNKAGGLGASLYVFTQSFADWQKTLGEYEAKTVMDNMNTQIRLRMNDPLSCEIVSKEFGTVTKTEQNVIFEGGETGNIRFMSAQKEEWLISPHEVRRLPVGRALAKNDENIYLLDLPYYSGAKIKLRMPDLFDKKGFDFEAFSSEDKQYDRFFN
ncbi:TraM recognition domain-containing protein [Caminibacter sp.]